MDLQYNLLFAWIWILAGFVSGTFLGLRFHDENWLGGYSSHKRRMYRLGHISFFGLAAVNFIFYFTFRSFDAVPPVALFASIAFILGGVSMPLCCWAMAQNKTLQWLFAVPVLNLISGAVLTLTGMLL